MSRYMPQLEQALASGKGAGGKSLTDGERAYYTEILTEAKFMLPEVKQTPKAPPAATFDKQMVGDLGRQKVDTFLGRGNTGGDSVISVPDAIVVMTGDLLVAPTPFALRSFIDQWIETMHALAAIDATTIVSQTRARRAQYMLLVTLAPDSLSQQAHAAGARAPEVRRHGEVPRPVGRHRRKPRQLLYRYFAAHPESSGPTAKPKRVHSKDEN